MSLEDALREVDRAGSRATAQDAEIFNAQYAMAQREQQAATSVQAAGNERGRRDEAERRAAEDRSDQFRGSDDEDEIARAALPQGPAAPEAADRRVPKADEADDDDAAPGHWLS